SRSRDARQADELAFREIDGDGFQIVRACAGEVGLLHGGAASGAKASVLGASRQGSGAAQPAARRLGLAGGSVMRKVVPRRGALSKLRSPPSEVTIVRVMKSPSPVPSFDDLVVKKASKMRS